MSICRQILMRKSRKEEFDYNKTLVDVQMFEIFMLALEDTTSLAAQLYRANHGGGMPCPDKICVSKTYLDNL